MNNELKDIKADDLKLPIVLGITGHRDIKQDDIKQLKEKIREIYQSLIKKYPSTPLILLTPLADGADRLVAKVALDEYSDNITVSVPLPFDIDTYETTFGKGIDGVTPEASKEEFKILLTKVNEQKNQYVPKTIPMIFYEKKYSSLNSEEQRLQRRKQYSIVGEYIAVHSHILIALWDKCSEEKTGGTGEIVRKKLSGEYDHFRLSDEDVTYPEQGVVYHISTPRVSSEKISDSFNIRRLFPNDVIKKGLDKANQRKINQFTQYHRKIENFNKDVKKNHVKISEAAQKDINKFECNNDVLIDKNIMLRRSAAFLARDVYQKIMNRLEVVVILLTSVTIFLIGMKSNFPNIVFHKYIDIIYIFLALIIFLLLKWFNTKKEKHEDYRALAEGLRVQTAWNMAKINDSAALYYLSHQKGELGWIRTALRCINVFHLPIDNKEKINIDLLDKYWINEQIGYFNKNIPEKQKQSVAINKKIKFYFIVFVISAIANGIFGFTDISTKLSPIFMNLTIADFFQVLFIVLPLSYLSYLKSKQHFDGNDELLREYTLSLDIFQRADKLIKKADIDKQSVYKNLGVEALRENSSWIITRRTKEYTTPSN